MGNAFHEVGCAMEKTIAVIGQTNIILDAELLNDLQCHHDDLLGDQQKNLSLMPLWDHLAFA